ncbi:MAG: MFS transporter [Clostridia bacterium]|nr:MFS transporter [Clostridia bacterium]
MKSFRRVKLACYSANISMSIVGNLSPILFLTFHYLYGISYTLLGLLVLINFISQLFIDLAFSFFSHKFNIHTAVKMTPALTLIGLALFAFSPVIFPSNVYIGLVIGTVVFSASSGFAEVLISPVIAAIPSENPEREMSKLHSIYAWGVVGVIVVGTLFLLAFGNRSWQILTMVFCIVPLISLILFSSAKLPKLQTPERISGALDMLKHRDLWICVLCIFLGGAAECTMAQWSSGYIEMALGIPKIWGDIFGVALFGLMLGLGRTMYANYGKNIERVLFLGAIGATLCYLTASISGIAVLGLIACAFTGFCVSMMWPGSLIVAEKRFPTAGVFIFAMMAAGGDLGASVGPQLVGIVTDAVSVSSVGIDLASRLNLTPEQLGMKCGMLIGMLFCFTAIFVYLYVMKKWKLRKITD